MKKIIPYGKHFIDNEDIKVIGDNKEYKSPIYNMTLNRKNIVGKVVYKF